MVKFGIGHPWAHWLWFRKNQCEGPCEDHVLAIKGTYFSHLWERGIMGYTQNCEIWHGSSLGTLIMIHEEPIWWTMFWPWEGHVFAISRKRGLWDTHRIVKFGMKHPCVHQLWFRKNQYKGPCEEHVLAIKGQFFGQIRSLHGPSNWFFLNRKQCSKGCFMPNFMLLGVSCSPLS